VHDPDIPFSLKCPSENCRIQNPESLIKRSLAKLNVKSVYLFEKKLASFVEQKKKVISWCSKKGCNFGCFVGYESQSVVKCNCGNSNCTKCGLEDHYPCDCKTAQYWLQKLDPDLMTTKDWFLENTKDCPNCKVPIQTNKGCNHMTCRCGHEFCWLCLIGRHR